jgi:hypothetical protein
LPLGLQPLAAVPKQVVLQFVLAAPAVPLNTRAAAHVVAPQVVLLHPVIYELVQGVLVVEPVELAQ